MEQKEFDSFLNFIKEHCSLNLEVNKYGEVAIQLKQNDTTILQSDYIDLQYEINDAKDSLEASAWV